MKDRKRKKNRTKKEKTMKKERKGTKKERKNKANTVIFFVICLRRQSFPSTISYSVVVFFVVCFVGLFISFFLKKKK